MFDGTRKTSLKLNKGRNELFIAISKPKMEGWGFIARIDDLSGVELKKADTP